MGGDCWGKRGQAAFVGLSRRKVFYSSHVQIGLTNANAKFEQKQLENIFQPTPSCRNKYVLGGMHLTNPAFLPWAILKEISGTENGQTLKNIHMHDITLEEMNRQQVNFYQTE